MRTQLNGMRLSRIRFALARSVLRIAHFIIRAVWRFPGPGRLVMAPPISSMDGR